VKANDSNPKSVVVPQALYQALEEFLNLDWVKKMKMKSVDEIVSYAIWDFLTEVMRNDSECNKRLRGKLRRELVTTSEVTGAAAILDLLSDLRYRYSPDWLDESGMLCEVEGDVGDEPEL